MELIENYLGVEWSGPAIRPGLDKRHLIIESHRGLLDFGFGTWIWDLDLGLGFETGLGLDVLLLDQVLTIDI